VRHAVPQAVVAGVLQQLLQRWQEGSVSKPKERSKVAGRQVLGNNQRTTATIVTNQW